MPPGGALMLPQLRQLVVQLIDTPLGDTYVLTRVVGFNCAFPRREISLGLAPSHEIVALHREGLAWTSLTIGEDGPVVTLHELKMDSYLYDFANKIREA